MSLITSDRFSLIIGLGKTGFACAQYLAQQGQRFQVADSRQQPPYLAQLQQQYPDIKVHLGEFETALCVAASEIILSPGVSRQEPALRAALDAGVTIRGDIDVFAQVARKACVPIVAITGSNAKSTVTSLVGQMALEANVNVAVGGNLGDPAVSLLDDAIDLYVMELSSFQLESTTGLGADVACVLNVSPDHMDRYPNLMAYHQAKHRVFQGCKAAVVNADDALTKPLVADTVEQTHFGLGDPDMGQFGVRQHQAEAWLCQGLTPLMPVSGMAMVGQHNVANALAALALGQAVKLPMTSMLATLGQFTGLRHRCENVAQRGQVTFVNDSKGTNVGATVAALEGLAGTVAGKIILIAGGVGKAADFSDLVAPLTKYAREVILMGQDAGLIATSLGQKVATTIVADMAAAVTLAEAHAVAGDLVLLSPACASFDVYSGFEARGDHFTQLVRAL